MNFVEVDTSSLIGPALDWAVAKCKCIAPRVEMHKWDKGASLYSHYGATIPLEYSTNWSQGGPIIEREIESLYEHKPLECWAAKSKQGDLRYGPTPLIAAMRCYVASKLGDTVQIPKGLAQ